MGRESCQGLGFLDTCFFSASRPHLPHHRMSWQLPGPQEQALQAGQRSLHHTNPKNTLLGDCQIRTQDPQAMCRAWEGMASPPCLLRPCTQSWLLTWCTSRDSPTHGYADSSKGSPQLNWGQHWPSSRAIGTGTRPGSGQVGWGQNFLRQVSVASLQMQSWQSMLMVWPGYGEMTHEPDLQVSCSTQGQL